MTGRIEDLLSAEQAAWVRERVPGAWCVADMSWGLMASTVLHVNDGARDLVVKAGDATNPHIGRELSAHDGWTAPLQRTAHCARLIDGDPALHILILDHLPGELVQDTTAEFDADVHRQAGALLARLHAQEQRMDVAHEPRANARALAWLSGKHRLNAPVVRRARRILESDPAPPVTTVPTHGDWQPRNWLIDDGVVRIIDWGRFGLRPAASDLTRLAAQQWRGRPELEEAFLDGYGSDPRVPDRWRITALREAVGTACWAFQVGEDAFEAQGHRMLDEALATF